MPESQGGCLAVASLLESCFGVGSKCSSWAQAVLAVGYGHDPKSGRDQK